MNEGNNFVKQILVCLALILFFSITKSVFAFDSSKSVNIDGKTMQAYIAGSGEQTIILLSGWATEDPIDDFMPLADELSTDFKVVILEYLGYGSSDITTETRSNKKIVDEIRLALKNLNIEPPYILMPHSMSGLYSLYYSHNYPDEISAIIGLDASLPEKQLERWTAETFEQNKLDVNTCEFNLSIIDQWNQFYANSQELLEVKYNADLPVLAFLTSEQIESIDEMIKSCEMRTRWEEINKNMITNPEIQFIEVLNGEHYIHHDQTQRICQLTKEFLSSVIN